MINHPQSGNGHPVILIHGLAASLHDWDLLLPDLAARGYSAHAADLLGHGESDKPRQPSEYTSDAVFSHLSDWIDSLALSEPAILVGHSLGGYLSLRYTLENPGRVRGLVLVNPFYTLSQLPPVFRFFLDRPQVNVPMIERTPYWLFRLIVDVTSLQFGRTHENTHCLPEQVRIQTALDYKRADAGIYNIPSTLHDLTPDLGRITQPALVLWGARDQTIAPGTFPSLVEKLPDARSEILPDCGHVPHQCHTREFNEKVIAFLDSIPGAPAQAPHPQRRGERQA